MLRIRATSRVLAVLGDPVRHSVSPPMHNAAITALGLDAVYVALRVTPASLAGVLETCRTAGIGGNLTVPLKEAGARLMGGVSPLARAVGAVNTFWAEGDTLRGDNTDVEGIEDAFDALEVEGPVLLVGTGGSARAVAAAAVRRRLPLVVRSREPDRAAAFVRWMGELAAALEIRDGRAEPDGGQTVRTVVNATPRGLAPDDPPPVTPSRWREAQVALDLVYRPGETTWVRECRAAGLRAADGRVVLLGQGARAFERFFPGVRAPRDLMRAVVARALAS